MTTQLVSRVLPTANSPYSNLLVNGGFEVWQRGASFTNPAYASMTADRWWFIRFGSGGTPSVNVNRDTGTETGVGGTYCMRVDISSVGSGSTLCYAGNSYGTDIPGIRGKTVSISARVKTTIAGKIRLFAGNGASSPTIVSSGFHTGSGNWETLSVTVAVDAVGGTSVETWVGFSSDVTLVTGTYYIDNVMAVVSTSPVDFVPTHPADEMTRCLRYYQFGGGGNSLDFFTMNRDASHNYFIYGKQLFVPMATVPVVTLSIIQIYLIQDAIQGTAALATDQANWTTANDGVDTRVFNYQAIRNAPNSTYSNAQAQIGWVADTLT